MTVKALLLASSDECCHAQQVKKRKYEYPQVFREKVDKATKVKLEYNKGFTILSPKWSNQITAKISHLHMQIPFIDFVSIRVKNRPFESLKFSHCAHRAAHANSATKKKKKKGGVSDHMNASSGGCFQMCTTDF